MREVTAILFDASGAYLGTQHKELPSPKELLAEGDLRAVYEDDYQVYVQRAFGLSPGTIWVQEFSVPEERLAVYRWPKHFQQFLADPTNALYDDDDRNAYPRQIDLWKESGQFVFEWGNDYWLDSNGEIVAS